MATHKKLKRKRAKQIPCSLAEMPVEQFMASMGGSDDSGNDEETPASLNIGTKRRKKSNASSHSTSLSQLASTDPEFYQFLQDNDQQLLDFTAEDSEASEASEGGVSDSDDSIGKPELRPSSITSRNEILVDSDQESSVDDDNSESGNACDASDACDSGGEKLTRAMVLEWIECVCRTCTLTSIKQLTHALNTAIAQILNKDDLEVVSMPTYHIESASVFNLLVLSCLKHIGPSLAKHLPPAKGRSGLPSTHKAWPQVKKIIKPYLSDLLSLITNLRDPAMQCAVIKSLRSLSRYTVCLPQVCKGLEKQLVESWSAGENHVQVMAFLALRELTLLKPHPSLSNTLKKLYMAFVRNCKFTSAETLPRVRFMQSCLMELLSLDTTISYQLGFVYIRQLAIHLRAAITSGRKEAQQTVYNWQFVHCLNLWGRVLGHVTDVKLRPLIYPLVQVVVGTLALQPSPRYYPLRLHLTRALIELASTTDSFIPAAPYLLEVLENYGSGGSSRLQTGKPPDLLLLLRATKAQLQSRAYQSAVLNCCFEQLLSFSVAHSHLIGYPELMFPITTRLRRVAKTTPLSWLKLQLQQLVTKVDEVAKATEREREKVNFSPSQSEKISTWETARKGQQNALIQFQSTWASAHSTDTKGGGKKSVAKSKPHPPSDQDTSDDGAEDVVEDFDLSESD